MKQKLHFVLNQQMIPASMLRLRLFCIESFDNRLSFLYQYYLKAHGRNLLDHSISSSQNDMASKLDERLF